MPTTEIDVISYLAGIQPGSPLAELRAQRPEATHHAQGSYAALFEANDISDLTVRERLATALRAATLRLATRAAAHYRTRLIDAGGGEDVPAAEVIEPIIPPAAPTHALPAPAVTPRLSAIVRHADLLAFAPRHAQRNDLQLLADVGLSTRGIVTLSQVIGFVSFQLRVIRSLELLGGEANDSTTPGGAPRAERELSAAATSRLNGCIYCASVHARLAAQLGKRSEDIDRLLLDGVTPGTDLGLDERWQGVVDLAGGPGTDAARRHDGARDPPSRHRFWQPRDPRRSASRRVFRLGESPDAHAR
jgi:CMD domain protein